MSNELSPKMRILNSLKGLEIDRPAWSPFLAYYWDTLPESTKKEGELKYLQDMGADPLLRGSHELFNIVYKNCNVTTKATKKTRRTTYETPVGTLTEEYTYSLDSHSWFLTTHSVTDEEDFKILQYIYENMEITENLKEFAQDYITLGEQGLYLPLLGTRMKTSFQSLLEHWCGTIDLTYALYDFPEIVDDCLHAMLEKDMQTAAISCKSKAEAFLFYEDSSTTNISPDFFTKYSAPLINSWGKLLHDNDKLLIHHACGHIRDLIPLMNQTEADIIESISPPPTGNIDIPEAFTLLNSDKGLIGGIEPTFFAFCSLPELEQRIYELLECTKSKRFVLANSDSCPPNVAYDKFLLVSKIIHEL